jgi:hypothetical protein
MADDAADGGTPNRICDLETGQPQVRNLPGREHEQHTAVLEPAQGFPHGADIDASRAAAAERVDRDGQIPQLGDAIQENVRHDFHIGPATQESVHHDDAFNPAERVVPDDDGRAFPGDVLQILRFDDWPHIQSAQNLAHEEMGVALGSDLFMIP